MTIAYLDASAIVKLLLEEDGSEEARLLYEGAAALFASRLATAEVASALAAARRAGRIEDGTLREAMHVWSVISSAVQPVELTEEVADAAVMLPAVHALSGAGAIHLASALTLADAAPIVATWDDRLRAAARTSGLETMPGD